MNKKAQGISINVVIMAVIAIIVAVILIVTFAGKSKMFTKNVMSCTEKQGVCLYDKAKEPTSCDLFEGTNDRPLTVFTADCPYYDYSAQQIKTDRKQSGPCCLVLEESK